MIFMCFPRGYQVDTFRSLSRVQSSSTLSNVNGRNREKQDKMKYDPVSEESRKHYEGHDGTVETHWRRWVESRRTRPMTQRLIENLGNVVDSTLTYCILSVPPKRRYRLMNRKVVELRSNGRYSSTAHRRRWGAEENPTYEWKVAKLSWPISSTIPPHNGPVPRNDKFVRWTVTSITYGTNVIDWRSRLLYDRLQRRKSTRHPTVVVNSLPMELSGGGKSVISLKRRLTIPADLVYSTIFTGPYLGTTKSSDGPQCQ